MATALGSSTFRFAACSGAKIEAFWETTTYKRYLGKRSGLFLEESTWNEPAQFNSLGAVEGPEKWSPNPDLKLVSLSIGGNNTGFGEILEKCVSKLGEKKKDEWATLNAKCKKEGDLIVDAGITWLEGANVHALKSTLEEIHAIAPNAWVRVLLYPQIISDITQPGSEGEDVCNLGGGGLSIFVSSKEIKDFIKWEKKLNEAIAKVVKAFGKPLNRAEPSSVEGVDDETALNGGNLCTATPTLVNSIKAFALSATAEPESAHPTGAGYKLMSEKVLESLEEILIAGL